MIRIFKQYWWIFLWFAVGGVFNGLMDFFDFKVAYNTGFWSLHTEGSRLDAWHTSKIIMLGCFAIGMIGRKKITMYPILLIIMGTIYSLIHGLVYHRIF